MVTVRSCEVIAWGPKHWIWVSWSVPAFATPGRHLWKFKRSVDCQRLTFFPPKLPQFVKEGQIAKCPELCFKKEISIHFLYLLPSAEADPICHENPERTHVGTGRSCKLPPERPQSNPQPFYCEASNYSTILPRKTYNWSKILTSKM